jgi:acetyl/propionyl-CoA carboxylase alpha subunit
MNTRLQVEHPITEFVTGIDLAKWQLRIASGEELSLKQEDISQRGHAIECRIYAEDPEKNFMPSPGKLYKYKPPSGVNVRHDSGIAEGSEVSPFYDPMLAKLITYAEDRPEAIRKMGWALSNYVALGVTTNISFLKDVVLHPEFASGNITTHFIDQHFKDWSHAKGELPDEILIAVAIEEQLHSGKIPRVTGDERFNMDAHSPWKSTGRWRIGEG